MCKICCLIRVVQISYNQMGHKCTFYEISTLNVLITELLTSFLVKGERLEIYKFIKIQNVCLAFQMEAKHTAYTISETSYVQTSN